MAKPKIAPWMKRVPNSGCSGGSSQSERDKAREEASRGASWRGDAKAANRQSDTK